MTNKKPVLILGIGNLILKDEGFGVHVVRQMADIPLPDNVELMDGGTMGIDLLYYIEGRKKVVVIDVVDAGSPPGTLYRFTDKNIEYHKEMLRSAHEIDFAYILKMAEQLGTIPDEVVFIGITPREIEPGVGLTPVLEEKIPQVIELVMKELKQDTGDK
ncbi:MAG: HyaD/HybD family hydrogenase maturation endopeptidase [Thermodesulfovibrionales bacterium]